VLLKKAEWKLFDCNRLNEEPILLNGVLIISIYEYVDMVHTARLCLGEDVSRFASVVACIVEAGASDATPSVDHAWSSALDELRLSQLANVHKVWGTKSSLLCHLHDFNSSSINGAFEHIVKEVTFCPSSSLCSIVFPKLEITTFHGKPCVLVSLPTDSIC